MNHTYESKEPTRDSIDQLAGATLLWFGSPTCEICHMTQPLLDEALSAHPEIRHIKIADGSGRPLGRSFKVKLWPTLIFLHDGAEVERLVRPTDVDAIAQALQRLDRLQPTPNW